MTLLTALLGSAGFALLFNVRKQLLPLAALGGALCWGAYLLAGVWTQSVFVQSFAASAVTAVWSEILARVKKTPAQQYLIVGLIPLVPGATLYYAMSAVVQQDWAQAQFHGYRVTAFVLGIAAGVSLTLKYWKTLGADARAAFRFQHISTDEVYGTLGETGFFTERTPYSPHSPYSASKAASDHLVRAWHDTYGLPTLITNCSNNYGPYHFPEKLIPLIILNCLDGKPLPVYGKGANIRDWLYVDDHARALLLVNEKGAPGETYNVGGHNERTNLEVVKTVCGILDELRPRADGTKYESLIAFVADRPGHDLRYAIDPAKLMGELGWRPRENFETGIRRTVQWYLDNRWWWGPIHEKKYAGERLGTGK